MKKNVLIITGVILLVVIVVFFIASSNNVWTSDRNIIDFRLVFTENKNVGKKKIISKNMFNKDSYNVYLYNGDAKVIINNNEYDLKEALNNNKLTFQDILNKAKKEAVANPGYDDGGTEEYYFEDFMIIKYKTLRGNTDLYIGSKDLNYSIGEN